MGAAMVLGFARWHSCSRPASVLCGRGWAEPVGQGDDMVHARGPDPSTVVWAFLVRCT